MRGSLGGSIAVGSGSFVEQVKIELGFKERHRQIAVAHGLYTFEKRLWILSLVSNHCGIS